MENSPPTQTLSGLSELLGSAIDYAGLFPPAMLDIPNALKNYAAQRVSSERWMVSKFVCPVGKLADVVTHWKTISNSVLPVVLVGRSAETTDEFIQVLDEDVHLVKHILDANLDSLSIVCYELRLPEAVTHRMPSYATYELLNRVADLAEKNIPTLTDIFFESSLKGDWKNTIPSVLDSIFRTRVQRQKDALMVRNGFKIRCGGPTAEDFPSIDLLALALRSCKNAQIPLKFTAGLHHPLRHFSDELLTTEHGFLNVMVAGLLTWKHSLDIDTLKNILNETVGRRFVITETAVGWGNITVDLETVKQARREFVTSFGSCSVDEPVHDLKALNFL